MLTMSRSWYLRTMLLLIVGLSASCSSGSAVESLPLDAILELPPEDEHRARWEQIERDKQDCMAGEGFEYIPHVQARFDAGGSSVHVRGALIRDEHREWVEANGYGLAASVIESNDFNDSDPNLDLRRALAQAAAEAYDSAFDLCTTQAQSEAGFDTRYVDIATEVSHLVAELETEIVSDPRLDDRTRIWAECMSLRGHSYRRLSDPRDDIAERLHAVQTDPPEQAKLLFEDLLRQEIALAVDDLDCRVESGADETLSAVSSEADAEFVDRHHELLGEYYSDRHGS